MTALATATVASFYLRFPHFFTKMELQDRISAACGPSIQNGFKSFRPVRRKLFSCGCVEVLFQEENARVRISGGD